MNFTPTRTELLLTRNQIKLAKKGHSLLKKKRDALIRIFFEKIKEYEVLHAKIYEFSKDAFEELARAQAVSGISRVKTMGYSQHPILSLEFERKKVMGVALPAIKVKKQDLPVNASVIGTGFYVHSAREKFISLTKQLLELGVLERSIQELASAIKKARRQVNSLENIIIPRLEDKGKSIALILDEQEREAFIRLKKIKKRLENAS